MEVKQYVQAIQEKLESKDKNQEEFLQAMDEFMPTVMSFSGRAS